MPRKPHVKAAPASNITRKAAGNSVRSPVPNWPPLQPLLASTDLALETLLEDQIIVVRNLFTPKLCNSYVSFLSSLPLTTTPAKPNVGEAVRLNDRIQFDDPAFAEQLWSHTALKSLVNGSAEELAENSTSEEGKTLWEGEVCGLNPRIRIYRYGIFPLKTLTKAGPLT